MKMNEFMTTLQAKLDDLQPKYPNNAESILEVLYNTYNEYLEDMQFHVSVGSNCACEVPPFGNDNRCFNLSWKSICHPMVS